MAKKFLDFLGVDICSIGKHIFIQPRNGLRPEDYVRIHMKISRRLISSPEIFLHINCFDGQICREFGGLVTTIMKNKRITATTFGIESAPAFLFLCAKNRVITKNAQLSLHGGLVRSPVGMLENVGDNQLGFSSEISTQLRAQQDILWNILSARTTLSEEEIKKIMSGHRDISPRELLEIGAVEHVV